MRQHEQKGRIQVDTLGLVGAAAMHDLHVIQGPNVTRDAREKIAFFAFHAFVVEEAGGRLKIAAKSNLVPRAHVPFGQHQDTELWNNQQARSQSPRVFCF